MSYRLFMKKEAFRFKRETTTYGYTVHSVSFEWPVVLYVDSTQIITLIFVQKEVMRDYVKLIPINLGNLE